jgi:hypothetical protein
LSSALCSQKNILKEEEIMPIVDGKYEARISITYANPEKGIDAIKKTLERSRKARISNILMFLLHDLKPLLQGKDVMLVLPLGERPSDRLQALGKVAVTKAKIYKSYKGTDAYVGSLFFSYVIFNITWANDTIFEIDAMEYGKCIKCMKGTFETGWRYSQK